MDCRYYLVGGDYPRCSACKLTSMPMEPGHPFTTGCGTQDPVSSGVDYSASPGQEMC